MRCLLSTKKQQHWLKANQVPSAARSAFYISSTYFILKQPYEGKTIFTNPILQIKKSQPSCPANKRYSWSHTKAPHYSPCSTLPHCSVECVSLLHIYRRKLQLVIGNGQRTSGKWERQELQSTIFPFCHAILWCSNQKMMTWGILILVQKGWVQINLTN